MKKVLLTSALAIGIALSSFGQKCTKFIDYQNKTINTKGLNMKLLGQPIGVGETSVVPLYRTADKELQRLDMLQYNLCEQLKNIKIDFLRDKLTTQYTNLLMKMMKLQEPASDIAVADNTKTANSEPKEEVAEGIVKETTVDNGTTPAPSPKPAKEEVNIDAQYCDGSEFQSNENFIRATGYGWSMDKTNAKREARTAGLEDLAISIEVTVKALTDSYCENEKINVSEEFRSRLENMTRTSVNQTISGVTIVCEKYVRNPKNNNWECHLALEVSKENVLKGIYNKMRQDAEGKKTVSNYESFKQTFDEVMKEYETSEVIDF